MRQLFTKYKNRFQRLLLDKKILGVQSRSTVCLRQAGAVPPVCLPADSAGRQLSRPAGPAGRCSRIPESTAAPDPTPPAAPAAAGGTLHPATPLAAAPPLAESRTVWLIGGCPPFFFSGAST